MWADWIQPAAEPAQLRTQGGRAASAV